MSLTKEQCEKSLEALTEWASRRCYNVECKNCSYFIDNSLMCQVDKFVENLYQLINEHFELKEKHSKLLDEDYKKLVKEYDVLKEKRASLMERYAHEYALRNGVELELYKYKIQKFKELEIEDCETYTPYFNETLECWCYFPTLHKDLGTGTMVMIDEVPTIQAFKFDDYTFINAK